MSAPVAVVGGGLGGLSAAVHLRSAGREVVLFEAQPRLGGRANLIEQAGFRFDSGPSLLNYPWVYEDLFKTADTRLEEYVDLLPVDPSLTFYWPGGEVLTLSSDAARMIENLSAFEKDAGPAYLRFLQDAGAKYELAFEKLVSRNVDNPLAWAAALTPREMARVTVWRSLYSELGRFFRSRHVREAFGSYGMYLGGSPFELPGFFSILAYGELAQGLWLPKGGMYGLVEGLGFLLDDLGVEVRTDCPVERIVVKQGAVQGVRLHDGALVRVPAVVSNVDAATTDANLLGHVAEAEPRRRKHADTRMTSGVITMYWGIKGKVEGLGHHSIFLPGDYRAAFDDLFWWGRVPRDLPFYTSMPCLTDPDLAPPGHTGLFVLVPTPVLSEMPGMDWDAAAADAKARVLERLALHGVSLDPADIVFEQVWTPVDWGQQFALHDGSAFGAAHTLFQLGPFRAANYARTIEGMYYTGASTTPGTGVPMVTLSGKLTAQRIADHAR